MTDLATSTDIAATDAAPESAASFDQFGLHPNLLTAIAATGYTTPTPIQTQAIPVIINGRDVMGAAQTGTGKTAAFTLPILHRLMATANTSASPARHPVRALILAPTRELADQVAENVKRYSKFSPLRAAVVFGGVDIGPQREAVRRGCEVLIATPGRLLDHIEQKNINLGQVSTFVLDEADRMLDMGFLPDLERIIRLLPKQRQNLLFSATFSNDIRKLARTYLTEPVEIETAGRNAIADTLTQVAYQMTSESKRAAVVHLVKSRGLKQVIVFSNTKIGTARLARLLEKDGVRAESIHGDKTQGDRMKALEAFKAGELEVLVATDVAARGLDVAGIPCVINYDLPYNAEDYVHRIGRTGRAGAKGEAIALFTAEEERLLLDVEKLIKTTIPRGVLDIPASITEVRTRTERPERSARPPRSAERSTAPAASVEAVPVAPSASPVAPERSERPARAPRDSRDSRSSSGSTSRARYDSRPTVTDDFFLKPYEPSASAATAEPENTYSRPTQRRQVGALLGGGKKA
jgi:ATP-dependent RNA helicase RhlE